MCDIALIEGGTVPGNERQCWIGCAKVQAEVCSSNEARKQPVSTQSSYVHWLQCVLTILVS
jgi:hypothetical protein